MSKPKTYSEMNEGLFSLVLGIVTVAAIYIFFNVLSTSIFLKAIAFFWLIEGGAILFGFYWIGDGIRRIVKAKSREQGKMNYRNTRIAKVIVIVLILAIAIGSLGAVYFLMTKPATPYSTLKPTPSMSPTTTPTLTPSTASPSPTPTSIITWNIQTVDSTGVVGGHSSIALDSSGKPHISYYAFTNGLRYAKWTGSAWSIATVDSTGDAGATNSLTLDTKGKPHISYLCSTTSDLKYAWLD